MRALLLDPVDLRGLPFLGTNDRSKWATPDFLPRDGESILFLDELNAAPAMVQASCYQLVLDRKLGNIPFCRWRSEQLGSGGRLSLSGGWSPHRT